MERIACELIPSLLHSQGISQLPHKEPPSPLHRVRKRLLLRPPEAFYPLHNFSKSIRILWSVVSISNTVPSGRPWVRLLAGERGFFISRNVQRGSQAHTAACSIDAEVLSQCHVLKLTTHPLLVPRIRMSKAITPLYLYAFIVWTGTALHFYLTSVIVRNMLFLKWGILSPWPNSKLVDNPRSTLHDYLFNISSTSGGQLLNRSFPGRIMSW